MEEGEDHIGIRRAARRRLEIELGINPESIDLSEFKLLTRIMYGAPSDGKWGEHEIDYILFLRKDVVVKPNPNEVALTAYVPLSGFTEFQNFVQSNHISFTPWFNLILNSYLMDWWKKVDNLDAVDYDPTIHRL
jgi:isopentenyl-diphosphate delta-isomerase